MTLKHLAILLMLLALGCTASDDTKSSGSGSEDSSGSSDPNATTQTEEPAVEPELTEVSFTVENMR